MNRIATSFLLPHRFASGTLRLALILFLSGCGAVFPELTTPVRSVPAGRELVPQAPEDLLYIAFSGAKIPEKTRDGRQWDALGGHAPDPFAQLFIDDKEVVRTPIQSNTLTPTWPDQKRANYRVPLGAKVRVELWDSNPINNHPICVKKVVGFQEAAVTGKVDIECDSGALVSVVVGPAHAKIGVGLYYELRSQQVYVTRVVRESPAAREGIQKGDQILEIQGKRVHDMAEGDAQSLINSNAQIGVKLKLKDSTGREREVDVKDGPMYPVVDENIPVD